MVEMTRAQYKAQGMELSQEQAEMTVKAMRDQIARMMGAAAGVQMAASQMQMQRSAPMMPAPQLAAAPAVAQAGTSEAQLAQAIQAWPPKPTPFAVNQRRDGLTSMAARCWIRKAASSATPSTPSAAPAPMRCKGAVASPSKPSARRRRTET